MGFPGQSTLDTNRKLPHSFELPQNHQNHHMPQVLTCKPCKKPAPYKSCIVCLSQEKPKKGHLLNALRRKHAKTSPYMTGWLFFNLLMNTHPCPSRPSWSTLNPRLWVHWSSYRQLCPRSWKLRCMPNSANRWRAFASSMDNLMTLWA